MNKTYEEWKKEYRYIVKGEKATGRNSKGEATFSQEQTRPILVRDVFTQPSPKTYRDGIDPDTVADDGLSWHENEYTGDNHYEY